MAEACLRMPSIASARESAINFSAACIAVAGVETVLIWLELQGCSCDLLSWQLRDDWFLVIGTSMRNSFIRWSQEDAQCICEKSSKMKGGCSC